MKLFISTIALIISLWSNNATNPIFQKAINHQSEKSELEKIRSEGFNGLWVNVDQNTPRITKCKIHYNDNRYIVQMWSSCGPEDCYWGENNTNEVEEEINKFEIFWNIELAESAMTFEIIDGKLKLTNKRHFKDNSGRPDNTITEYFVKQ